MKDHGRCQKNWNELTPVSNSEARSCKSCSRYVFPCTSRDELALAEALGRCVATHEGGDLLGWVGQHPGDLDWMESQEHKVLVRLKNPPEAPDVFLLLQMYPKINIEQLSQGDWVILGAFTKRTSITLLREIEKLLPELEARGEV